MSIHPGRGLAYYNEVEPFASAWLRELMAEGLIAPGVIDERPIQEVQPSDVEPYTQAHFFAGIGVWSYALRSAGWDDSWPVWTGSCPCQPFSGAGKRQGTADDRHLWPEWFRLIRQSRPDVLFGEQVSSPGGLVWVDSISADLESLEYAFAPLDTCAAGLGAPHIRQRLYFVAESDRVTRGLHVRAGQSRRADAEARGGRAPRRLADTERGRGGARRAGGADRRSAVKPDRLGAARVMGDSGSARGGRDAGAVPRAEAEGEGEGRPARGVPDVAVPSGITRGFWGGAVWIPCSDGKLRPTQPGIFPLAHGTPGRVGLLRGAGNALCRPQAQAFVEAYLGVVAEREASA